MKMKNGQTQQIFTWIFMLILAVTVLFFGIKTFRSGEDFKDEILLVDFYKNLEKKINDFYFLDVRSGGREDFILPSGVREVCFINLNGYSSDGSPKGDYIQSLNSFSNVFVFPQTEFKENRAKLDRFFVGGDIICPTVTNGRVEIRFVNDANGVKIEEPNP